jgi:hypothetical protein
MNAIDWGNYYNQLFQQGFQPFNDYNRIRVQQALEAQAASAEQARKQELMRMEHGLSSERMREEQGLLGQREQTLEDARAKNELDRIDAQLAKEVEAFKQMNQFEQEQATKLMLEEWGEYLPEGVDPATATPSQVFAARRDGLREQTLKANEAVASQRIDPKNPVYQAEQLLRDHDIRAATAVPQLNRRHSNEDLAALRGEDQRLAAQISLLKSKLEPAAIAALLNDPILSASLTRDDLSKLKQNITSGLSLNGAGAIEAARNKVAGEDPEIQMLIARRTAIPLLATVEGQRANAALSPNLFGANTGGAMRFGIGEPPPVADPGGVQFQVNQNDLRFNNTTDFWDTVGRPTPGGGGQANPTTSASRAAAALIPQARRRGNPSGARGETPQWVRDLPGDIGSSIVSGVTALEGAAGSTYRNLYARPKEYEKLQNALSHPDLPQDERMRLERQRDEIERVSPYLKERWLKTRQGTLYDDRSRQ